MDISLEMLHASLHTCKHYHSADPFPLARDQLADLLVVDAVEQHHSAW